MWMSKGCVVAGYHENSYIGREIYMARTCIMLAALRASVQLRTESLHVVSLPSACLTKLYNEDSVAWKFHFRERIPHQIGHTEWVLYWAMASLDSWLYPLKDSTAVSMLVSSDALMPTPNLASPVTYIT